MRRRLKRWLMRMLGIKSPSVEYAKALYEYEMRRKLDAKE